mmetsp:Transcript_5275/g.10059  ORF Transcript_5275/g.10059 Transcript_5275/m.10059 type:complete len:569 (+) Transcript_5275:310-2016(+)
MNTVKNVLDYYHQHGDTILVHRKEEEDPWPFQQMMLLLQPVSTFRSSFYFTKKASIITSCTGSISTISSALIMIVILRSHSKLLSTYHRIMFFMSFCDFVSSFAIALVTVPMPRDVMFPFELPSYGNPTTCAIQGFLAYIGGILAIFGNCTLSLYYLCNLRYKLKDKTLNKYLLPITFVLSIVFSVGPGVILWSNDLINPQVYDAYCKTGAYPYNCIFRENVECQRGRAESQFMIFLVVRYLFVVIVSGFCIIVVCMATITLSVCSCCTNKKVLRGCRRPALGATENTLKNIKSRTNVSSSLQHDDLNDDNNNAHTDHQQQEEKNDCTRSAITTESGESIVIVFQAFLYVTSFILTWIGPTLVFIIDSDLIRYMKIIFQPLQGFSNATIFIYHRVYNLRRSCPEIGLCEAVLKSIRDPKCVPEEFVASIDIVDMNNLLSVLRDDDSVESSSKNSLYSSNCDLSNDSHLSLIDSLSVRMAPSQDYSFSHIQDNISSDRNEDDIRNCEENCLSSDTVKSSSSFRLGISSETRKRSDVSDSMTTNNNNEVFDHGSVLGKKVVPRTYYSNPI